jgi:dolichyl-phosphate-mannose-protein mannosyltransferase
MNRLCGYWPLLLILVAAFALRAWHAERMAIEHFDEGVYASNLFADHLDFRYPDRHLYAPPLLPAILEWALILTGADPRSVMWVNVLFGTALVAAVWWTTRVLLDEGRGGDVFSFRFSVFSKGGRPRSEHGKLKTENSLPLPLGPCPSALTAATLVAFSDITIQYSRAALTDVSLCLWMTLAIGTGVCGLRTGGWTWLGLSSLLTALAWWTKYNGWLPLAVLGAGVGGWIVCTGQRQFLPVLGRWMMICLGAIMLWLPCLWELQEHGGYAAVAANHAGYVVGWSGWWESMLRHLEIQRHYTGAATCLGLFLAVLVVGRGFAPCEAMNHVGSRHPWCFPVTRGASLRVSSLTWLTAVLLAVLTWFAGLVPVLAVLACCGVWGMTAGSGRLRHQAGSSDSAATTDARLGGWILAAWLIGLVVATPLYRPYPRLLLPCLIGAMIAAGIGLSLLVHRLTARWTEERRGAEGQQPTANSQQPTVLSPPSSATLILVCCLVLLLAGVDRFPAWQDRGALERIAGEVIDSIQSPESKAVSTLNSQPSTLNSFVIYVLAEPGLYYHLASREDAGAVPFIAQPASNLGMLEPGKTDPRLPAYLLTGPHAREEREQLADRTERVTLIQSFAYHPSDLVLLDDIPPRDLARKREATIELWRIR